MLVVGPPVVARVVSDFDLQMVQAAQVAWLISVILQIAARLHGVQCGIFLVEQHQFLMGSLFDDTAQLKHKNLVCIFHRAEPMGDQDDSFSLHVLLE